MLNFLLKNNLLPDRLATFGIRQQLRRRIAKEKKLIQADPAYQKNLIQLFNQAPIALATDNSLTQHYAVPTDFFKLVLGKNLKYSAAFWENARNLDQAEDNMLALYCMRLKIAPHDRILDLGCGWGATALYIAKHFPEAAIYALSHSPTQAAYIRQKAQELNLNNVDVITADINQAEIELSFDKIISIEMFEHVRNHAALLKKLAVWLKPEGKLFVHHFCHRDLLYCFDEKNSWMARNFFTGGMMPNYDYLRQFNHDFIVEQDWQINGMHYQKTALAWLENLKKNKAAIVELFAANKIKNADLYWHYWRLFFLACAELFGYREGRQWFVAHYLLTRVC